MMIRKWIQKYYLINEETISPINAIRILQPLSDLISCGMKRLCHSKTPHQTAKYEKQTNYIDRYRLIFPPPRKENRSLLIPIRGFASFSY